MALPGRSVDGPGQRIGRYLITGRIGRGGMGMVYRGRDGQLERDVAVKTLTLEGALDEESLQRFAIEARAAARLQHPNIVTIYELGEDRGLQYIAMELLGGVDLETAMRSAEPLLLEEQLEIVLQVCQGLDYAHQSGIVHRDLKPSNIRVLDDGSAKLMDFGIAKLSGTNVTKSGMMVGTVHYMSPEQIRGSVLDGRSDVFSMGVILHELLAGSRPFQGQAPTAVLYKIVHEEPEPLPAELGPAGGRLREIVAHALAKDPAARTPSARALADELRGLLDELRAGHAAPAPRDQEEGLQQSRRLLAAGRSAEGLRWLREAVARQPDSLRLRRELRRAEREGHAESLGASPDEFPELLATFQASPTLLAPGPRTEARTTQVSEPTQPAARRMPRAALLAAVVLPVAFLLAAVLLLGRRTPAAASVLEVRSTPAGAHVFVDGKDSGVLTDGKLTLPPEAGRVVLGFRRAGYREATLTLAPPFDASRAVAVQLEPAPSASARVHVISQPPGASVALDDEPPLGQTPLDVPYDPARPHRLTLRLAGHRHEELQLAPGQQPARLDVALESDGPRGFVALSSAYPVDVALKGRTLVKGQTQVRLSLPEGRQTLSFSAPRYFLRSDATLDVPAGGEVAWRAPALGRLNIRASPDSCKVFVNGSFVDYPPILDRPVASGRLTVGFKWPDGIQSDESVELEPGGVAFVTGRKP